MIPGFGFVVLERAQKIQLLERKFAAPGKRIKVKAPVNLKSHVRHGYNQVFGLCRKKFGKHHLNLVPRKMLQRLTTDDDVLSGQSLGIDFIQVAPDMNYIERAGPGLAACPWL